MYFSAVLIDSFFSPSYGTSFYCVFLLYKCTIDFFKIVTELLINTIFNKDGIWLYCITEALVSALELTLFYCWF